MIKSVKFGAKDKVYDYSNKLLKIFEQSPFITNDNFVICDILKEDPHFGELKQLIINFDDSSEEVTIPCGYVYDYNKHSFDFIRTYNLMFNKYSNDIKEHLNTLTYYSNKCQHITEMGVREGSSTLAFFNSNIKRMHSYDIFESDKIGVLKGFSQFNNIIWEFHKKDTLQCKIEETDLLFIDTLHTYEQLFNELKIHTDNVKKYVILHDTTTYGVRDEIETFHHRKGLNDAIDHFLSLNKSFIRGEVYLNNNGLTILERINT